MNGDKIGDHYVTQATASCYIKNNTKWSN